MLLPVPVKFTLKVPLLGSLLVIFIVALRLPLACGVKVTTKVVLAPCATDEDGGVVTAKSPGLAPPNATPETVRAANPSFMIVNVWVTP